MEKERKKILEENEKALMLMADRYHLTESTPQSRMAEALSRYALERVFNAIDAEVDVAHNGQYATFDATITSGGTDIIVEGKVRYVSSTWYPTCDVSAPKIDALMAAGGWLVVYYYDDRRYAVYDVCNCHPKKVWRKKQHYTTQDHSKNWEEYEEMYAFDPAEAKFKGRIEEWKSNVSEYFNT